MAMKYPIHFLTMSALLPLCNPAIGFSLDPRYTQTYFDKNQSAHLFIPFLEGGNRVHEELTEKTLECDKPDGLCNQLLEKGISIQDIYEGVWSNDFPAAYLDSAAAPFCMGRVLRIQNTKDVPCILGSFVRAAKHKDKFNDEIWAYARPFGMRGHFGNLQFLHAMAPKDQTATDTYAGIYMWMKFAYEVSIGNIDLHSDAYAAPIEGMNKHFIRGSRKVGDLMNYRFKPAQVSGVALGQMLHIAQDSFAGCHTTRNAEGKIVNFLSYAEQNASRHSEYDHNPEKDSAVLSGPLNPVAFGKELLKLRLENAKWEKGVEQLIQRYFDPINPLARAESGRHCEQCNSLSLMPRHLFFLT